MTTSKAIPWSKAKERTRIERWENVVRVLGALTPKQREEEWDMAVFGYRSPCRTSACAAGHCSLDAWFRKRGFRGRWKATGWIGPNYAQYELFFPKNLKPHQFFGVEGTEKIFYNGMRRSVDTVIIECERHIQALRDDVHLRAHARARTRALLRGGRGRG